MFLEIELSNMLKGKLVKVTHEKDCHKVKDTQGRVIFASHTGLDSFNIAIFPHECFGVWKPKIVSENIVEGEMQTFTPGKRIFTVVKADWDTPENADSLKHLTNWLNTEFEDDLNKDNARATILTAWDSDFEYWTNKAYWEVLIKNGFAFQTGF